MINTRFGITTPQKDYVLDYADDIASATLDIDEDATGLLLPNGAVVPLSSFAGRTAGEDAEVDEDEYDSLPITYATIRIG